MNILFGVSSLKYSVNQKNYFVVEQTIKMRGHNLYFDNQYETAIESIGNAQNILSRQDWQILCKRELRAAEECEVAIFDVSNKASFGIGYIASICLARKVPTLFLLSVDSLNGSIISGLEHPNLIRQTYTSQNIQKVVEDFLEGIEK